MKQTNLTRDHSDAVTRGLVAATAARSFSWVEELANDSGVDITEGAVVVVLSDGTIQLADTVNDARPTGVALDDIEDGDSGQVCFGGPVDLVQVVASVTAGQYGATSTTPGEAQVTTASNALCVFTSSGTEPTAFVFPDRNGRGATIAGDLELSGPFELNIEGGQSVIKAHGSMGATETFDPTDGNVHTGTLDANCTFTLNAPAGAGACMIEVRVLQDGTGGWAITWPGSVTWAGGTPSPTTTPATTTVYLVETLDGGTTWLGVMVGGAAPSSADYLVGTAQAGLSAEIVVGTTPGGELGGSWAVPTVDATHSGSAHSDFIAKALVDAKGDLIAATAADTVDRVPVGTDGQLLKADSAATAGVSWVDAATSSGSHAHVVSETHLSDGATGLYTLDQSYESGSVIAWNVATLARLAVTETEPDQATVSPVGSAGDAIVFDYAATLV